MYTVTTQGREVPRFVPLNLLMSLKSFACAYKEHAHTHTHTQTHAQIAHTPVLVYILHITQFTDVILITRID